jgi:hypothetical protein
METIRIALECYGGIRCAFIHNHIERFLESFPFLKGTENVKVDVFLLTTRQDRKTNISKDDTIPELIEQLNRHFRNQLVTFEFFEDLSEEIREEENQLIEKWNQEKQKVELTEEERKDFFQDIFKGIEIQSTRHMRSFHLENLFTYLINNSILELEQDNYVPRLYYRKRIVNQLRKQYQASHPEIKYDWVMMARIFDIDYEIPPEKKNELEQIFSQKPAPDTVYVSIDNIVASTPEIIDSIYDELGIHYPITTYHEQWSLTDPKAKQFRETFRKMDDYLYFSRRDMTLSSENQLLNQCLNCSSNFVHLRNGYYNHFLKAPIYLNQEAYFLPILCPLRFEFNWK